MLGKQHIRPLGKAWIDCENCFIDVMCALIVLEDKTVVLYLTVGIGEGVSHRAGRS